MKNTKTGKLIVRILTALISVAVIASFVCLFFPYFSISEEYHYILRPNPQVLEYNLIDLMWTNTKAITAHFSGIYGNFDINDFVTLPVLSFLFGLGMIISSIWHTANEVRRYPDMSSGIVTNICCVFWGVFGLLGYLQNQLLSLGVAEYMYIRTVIIIILAVGTVLSIARFVVWLLTEIQIAKDRKARLALL